ncbi:MAG: TraV family lipoprotein [Desulforhopalus sp.]
MKHFKNKLMTAVASCLLSACSPMEKAINPYNEDFKCTAKNDVGECIDTPTAYKKARYPEIVSDKVDPTNGLHEAQDQRYRILAGLLQEEKKPILQPPKILRVLLLPYKGENEELFMTRYIYVKIENADWVLTDLTEK